MPVSMSFSPAFKASPRVGGGTPSGSIEANNKLGSRPCVRMSKIYRERESGNAMKSLFGQDHLSWKTEEQQGVFQGQGVYDAATADSTTQQQFSDRPCQTGGAPSSASYGQREEVRVTGSTAAPALAPRHRCH